MPQVSFKNTVKALEAEGWEMTSATDSHGHPLMEHPFAGRVSISVSPTTEDQWRQEMKRARLKVRRLSQASNAFYTWLCEKYEIEPLDRKPLHIKMAEEIREWLATPDAKNWKGRSGQPVGHNTVAVWMSDNFGRDDSGAWLIAGRDYADVATNGVLVSDQPKAEPGDVLCESKFEMKSGGLAVCTLPEGHDGLCYDERRKTRWPTPTREDHREAVAGVMDEIVTAAAEPPDNGAVGLPGDVVEMIKRALYPEIRSEIDNSLAAVSLAASELAGLSERLTLSREAYLAETAEIQQAIDETIEMLRSTISEAGRVS